MYNGRYSCSTSTLTPSQEYNTHKRGLRFVLHHFKSLGVAINVLSPEGASKLHIPQDDSTELTQLTDKDKPTMWKTPRVLEVAVGLEINCYACAEV